MLDAAKQQCGHQKNAAILAAQVDAALQRKVRRAPLARRAIQYHVRRGTTSILQRQSAFSVHSMLYDVACQAMRAARLEANTAEEDMRRMTASLKVRPQLLTHLLIQPSRAHFKRLSNCRSLYADRASSEQSSAQTHRRILGHSAGNFACICRTGLVFPASHKKTLTLLSSCLIDASSGYISQPRCPLHAQPASARGPMQPQPPGKRKGRGYQSARGRAVPLSS